MRISFYVALTTHSIFYFFFPTTGTRDANQNILIIPNIFRCDTAFVLSLNVSWLMVFVGTLFPFTTGAENGSSSQGMVGQSGPVAGSSGAMSKAAKGQGSTEKEEQAGNQKRARRQWESWSAEDKNSFFEGLYEVKTK